MSSWALAVISGEGSGRCSSRPCFPEADGAPLIVSAIDGGVPPFERTCGRREPATAGWQWMFSRSSAGMSLISQRRWLDLGLSGLDRSECGAMSQRNGRLAGRLSSNASVDDGNGRWMSQFSSDM